MRVAVEMTEAQMLQNWLNGCPCPVEGEWRNGERVITAVHVLLGCKIHQPIHETTGEHILHKLGDDPYIRPEEVPPPDLPDPAHHRFFDPHQVAVRGGWGGDVRIANSGHKAPKPIRGWDPHPHEWRTVALITVLLVAVALGAVFYPGW